MHFQDDNRRFTHGTITLIDADGTKRPLTDHRRRPDRLPSRHRQATTGGTTGCYGQWVGDLKVEGGHVTDCDKPENARQLHQLRDLLVRVEDPVGGGAA